MPAPIALLALALAGAVAAQAPAPPPDPGAAALLARMRAACGGDAWDRVQGWSETGRVDLPGRPGVPYEAFHSMRAPTMVTRNRIEGRIVRQSGYDGTVGWQAGPDGIARIERDPAALRRMRRDAYLSSAGWFLPARMPAAFALAGVETRDGRTFDVLRVTPEGADSFDLWVDRETRRIGRIVAGDEYAELGDYRTFSGICSATTGRQSDGRQEIVLHVESVDTGPVADSVFSPPAGPPAARPPVEHFGAPTLGGRRLPFSSAVRVGDILYLSGQIGLREDGTLPGGIEAQGRATMDNIGAILRSAGAGWDDVFRCTVMLENMADWPAFNLIYAGYFEADRMPARSALGADGLALGALVEVECQAHLARD